MARPNKYNLQYFPLDVTFFEDHKALMIEEDYGFKGGYIAIRLLAMVYEQGYYLDWKDKQELSAAKRIGNGFTGALVLDVLKACLKHGLFDKTLFDEHMVLSSRGIQKRWLLVMTQLRRRVEVNSRIWLISSEGMAVTSEETTLPATLTTPPETFSTQKESKLNEIEEKDIGHPPKRPGKIFVPPELKQVQDYFVLAIGNAKNQDAWPADKCLNEASACFDFYVANGWIQGRGKKIVDWKAACRTWIRNELKGVFKNPTHGPPKTAAEKQVSNPDPVKPDKLQSEVNYLFDRFCEDEDSITVISAEPVHYDTLKKAGLINFSGERIAEIRKEAQLNLNGNVDETKLLAMMKRLGVLQFFKELKQQNKKTVFDAN